MSARPELCVGGVAIHDGELLLIRRGHGPAAGEWSVPGGRVEHGETMAEAVRRELTEETGLDGTADRVLGWVERIGDGHHFVIVDYVVTVANADEARPGDDAASVRWFPLADVRTLPGVVAGLVEFLDEHGVLPADDD